MQNKMKYTKLKFNYNKFSYNETDSLNSYIKNKLYTTLGDHHMYVATYKVEEGKEKFKKQLLKYYRDIIKTVEEI